MHDKWEDMIPFYVAGTLLPAQRAALERHLDTCETCRRSLDEWRMIGSAVRAEAESWVRAMPMSNNFPRPVAAEQTVQATPAVKIAPRQNTRRYAIATLAAVIVVGVLLSSAILMMLSRRAPDSAAATEQIALNMTVEPTDNDFGAQLPDDLGIVSWTPVMTPTPTGTLSTAVAIQPSRTPLPNTASQELQVGVTGTPLPPSPQGSCELSTSFGTPVNIYHQPSRAGAIVDILDPGVRLLTTVSTADGWHQVIAPNIRLEGWVSREDIALWGTTCFGLPTPTVTATYDFTECTASSAQILYLRHEAFDASPVTGSIAGGTTMSVLARSDNAWTMVQSPDSSTGWVEESLLTLSGNCDNVDYVPGYAALETATATAQAQGS